jgi:hypothetical protein
MIPECVIEGYLNASLKRPYKNGLTQVEDMAVTWHKMKIAW